MDNDLHNTQFSQIEDYVAMLLEDADKLFEELVKKLGEVISGDTVRSSPSPSLPAFLPSPQTKEQGNTKY